MKLNKFILFYFFVCLIFSARVMAGSSITFEQRVAYQRAIEEVYWRHTKWPTVNPQPKPPLQLSDKDIRSKVTEYLRKSDAITGAQLQTEMDRMATETTDPQLLKEVWAALGNNPYLIAECFARSVLAERLIDDPRNDLPEFPVYNYRLPEIKGGGLFSTSALQLAATAPSARSGHTAVWTGTEMIIWGGNNGTTDLKSGKRYNPSTNSWLATRNIGAPSARHSHSAVWTGTVMIIWGGLGSNGSTDTGGRYNPSTNLWAATTEIHAPSGREQQTAVWTGTQMIIWGGAWTSAEGPVPLNTGGRYNPSTDSWLRTSTKAAPSARDHHTAVWTGGEMIIWGGCADDLFCVELNTGGRYNPSTNSWLATNATGAPSARKAHTAVWTLTQMIIWGGGSNTGARYNPSTNSWVATTTTSS